MEKCMEPNTSEISMPISRTFKHSSYCYHLMTTFAMLAVMLMMPQFAYANAGMLVTAEKGGKTYLLFVQTHKHDYYEFPGGRVENGENLIETGRQKETLYEAAVRETMEETRGYLGRQQLLTSSSLERVVELGKYSLYVTEVPFFELDDVRRIKIPSGKKWAPMREVVNYAWIDVDAVDKKHVVKTREGEVIKLHPIAQNVIKIARLKRWF